MNEELERTLELISADMENLQMLRDNDVERCALELKEKDKYVFELT